MLSNDSSIYIDGIISSFYRQQSDFLIQIHACFQRLIYVCVFYYRNKYQELVFNRGSYDQNHSYYSSQSEPISV